jgi:hypothetical protein
VKLKGEGERRKGLDLLHDGNRSGNSFRGRHYKNRGKLEK